MKRLRQLTPQPTTPVSRSTASPNGVNFQFPSEHNAYSQAVLQDLMDPKKAARIRKIKEQPDIWRPEFDDDFYLFSARQFDAKKAEQMLRDHLEWRREFRADEILEEFAMPTVLADYYTGGFCGHDREGRPWTCRRLLPRRRAATGRAIYQLTVVYDFAEFGRRQMWPPSLDLPIIRDHGLALVINAPSLFPALFNMLKPLLHKDTQSKIHVLGDNYQELLRQYIAPDQLPVCYGGTRRDPTETPPALRASGGQVPTEYYLRPLNADKLIQSSVGRRSALKVDLTVKPGEAPVNLDWEFVTEEGDIGFEVYLQGSNGNGAGPESTDQQQRQYIVQLGRVESDIRPISGSVVCQLPGTYIVKFDNGHSWTRSKKLSYYLELRPTNGDQSLLQLPFADCHPKRRRGGVRLRFVPPEDAPTPTPSSLSASASAASVELPAPPPPRPRRLRLLFTPAVIVGV
uniref:CRAL-TRIO domain-containing protein n=1 Tax=Macrostomum lignano TaxID=282301 RepID=A0A1I8GJG4_9PLAT